MTNNEQQITITNTVGITITITESRFYRVKKTYVSWGSGGECDTPSTEAVLPCPVTTQ